MIFDFRKNLGTTDRIIRAAIGLYSAWLYLNGTATGWWAVAAIFLAVFSLAEAATAY